MTDPVTIGVDLGGTKIAAGLVHPDGTIEFDCASPTPADAGPSAIIGTVVDLISGIRRMASTAGRPAPVAVGLGSAGVIDSVRGRVLSATDHLAGWAGTELAQEVTALTGLPVRAINDVHAHAIGEARYGAGRGLGTVLMVATGTGVGGSLVLDGTPVAGARHAAGHLGHFPSAAAQGLICSCGRVGHLESIASGPGLLRVYRDRGGQVADTRALMALSESGDSLARECVVDSADALGQAVGGWVNMLDPDVVIISGGMAGSGPLWWSTLTAAAQNQFIGAVADCRLVPAQRGAHAAILGAAAFSRDALAVPSQQGGPQ